MEEGRKTGSRKKEISLSSEVKLPRTRRDERKGLKKSEEKYLLCTEKKRRRIINSQSIAARLNKQ